MNDRDGWIMDEKEFLALTRSRRDEPFFLKRLDMGCKVPAPRQIEIWFVAHQSRHYIVSERREESQWVKNIQSSPEVHFSVGTRAAPEEGMPRTAGRARIVSAAAEPQLAQQIQTLMDAKYDWSNGLIVELTRAGAA